MPLVASLARAVRAALRCMVDAVPLLRAVVDLATAVVEAGRTRVTVSDEFAYVASSSTPSEPTPTGSATALPAPICPCAAMRLRHCSSLVFCWLGFVTRAVFFAIETTPITVIRTRISDTGYPDQVPCTH